MEQKLLEYLASLSYETLFELSRESEESFFEEDSRVRFVVRNYLPETSFTMGLIFLRDDLLTEITKRHFEKNKN